MLVVDASIVVVALADDEDDGDVARRRLRGETLSAPQILDLEVLSVLRKMHRRGTLDSRRADLAINDLQDLPVVRVSHSSLLRRCWELRDNLTPLDAAYVALAEATGATFLTGDRRLSTAPGILCKVEVLNR